MILYIILILGLIICSFIAGRMSVSRKNNVMDIEIPEGYEPGKPTIRPLNYGGNGDLKCMIIFKIMEQWTAPACGSIRIKKATTLQSWIDKGWYQREINDGYTFAPACGRFRVGKCECSRCRKPNGGWEKKAVLERNGLLNGL